MKSKHLLLGGAFLLAAWLALFGDKTPASDIASPIAGKERKITPNKDVKSTHKAPESGTNPSTMQKNTTEPLIAQLINREALLGEQSNQDLKTSSLFHSQTWTPTLAPVKIIPQAAQLPVAPPIPFSVLGKKWEDGIWEVFLGRNEQTFIVREKMILDDLYRIESIQPPTLTLTYLPLNQVQVLTIGSSD
nr:hypothetical protein [uncultured Undibacterium sp.]